MGIRTHWPKPRFVYHRCVELGNTQTLPKYLFAALTYMGTKENPGGNLKPIYDWASDIQRPIWEAWWGTRGMQMKNERGTEARFQVSPFPTCTHTPK